MTRSTLLAISVAALALSSCGKKPEPVSGGNDIGPANEQVTESKPVAPALSAGQQFANTAAASDTFEIESSRLAAENAGSKGTKSFAKAMIEAHTESTAKLKAAASAASPAITPDPTLTAEQSQTLEALKGKKGAEFDSAYKAAQANGHTMTLDALRAYSASGDVPSLKSFATAMVPIVTAHLNMAKGL